MNSLLCSRSRLQQATKRVKFNSDKLPSWVPGCTYNDGYRGLISTFARLWMRFMLCALLLQV